MTPWTRTRTRVRNRLTVQMSMTATLMMYHIRQNCPGRRQNSPDPQKSSKSRIAAAGGQTIKSANCTKLRNANAVPMGPKSPENSPGGTELRPKRPSAGNIWFNPGSNPGPHPPRVGDRPQKPVNRDLPGKLLNTSQRRQHKKVAQRERGSDEPINPPKIASGAE